MASKLLKRTAERERLCATAHRAARRTPRGKGLGEAEQEGGVFLGE